MMKMDSQQKPCCKQKHCLLRGNNSRPSQMLRKHNFQAATQSGALAGVEESGAPPRGMKTSSVLITYTTLTLLGIVMFLIEYFYLKEECQDLLGLTLLSTAVECCETGRASHDNSSLQVPVECVVSVLKMCPQQRKIPTYRNTMAVLHMLTRAQ